MNMSERWAEVAKGVMIEKGVVRSGVADELQEVLARLFRAAVFQYADSLVLPGAPLTAEELADVRVDCERAGRVTDEAAGGRIRSGLSGEVPGLLAHIDFLQRILADAEDGSAMYRRGFEAGRAQGRAEAWEEAAAQAREVCREDRRSGIRLAGA